MRTNEIIDALRAINETLESDANILRMALDRRPVDAPPRLSKYEEVTLYNLRSSLIKKLVVSLEDTKENHSDDDDIIRTLH